MRFRSADFWCFLHRRASIFEASHRGRRRLIQGKGVVNKPTTIDVQRRSVVIRLTTVFGDKLLKLLAQQKCRLSSTLSLSLSLSLSLDDS